MDEYPEDSRWLRWQKGETDRDRAINEVRADPVASRRGGRRKARDFCRAVATAVDNRCGSTKRSYLVNRLGSGSLGHFCLEP